MKRGTGRHPKVMHLAELLHCSRAAAIGYLELLWDFAAEMAPQGDIGKYPDRRILAAMDSYSKRLIPALIESKWIDVHPVHRLVIHDWHEHCVKYVRDRLAREQLPFLSMESARDYVTKKRATESGGVDAKVGGVDAKVGGVDAKVGGVDAKVGGGRERSGNLDTSSLQFHEDTDKLTQKFAAILPIPIHIPITVPIQGALLAPESASTSEPPELKITSKRRMDEMFATFEDDYIRTGAAVIAEDFEEAYQFEWKILDFEQKAQRQKSLLEHIERGDWSEPRFIPKPRKFIRTEWKRPIRGSPAAVRTKQQEQSDAWSRA